MACSVHECSGADFVKATEASRKGSHALAALKIYLQSPCDLWPDICASGKETRL